MKKTEKKKVAPRIAKKPAVAKTPSDVPEIDTAKAVAFGMDLVSQLKKEAAKRGQEKEAQAAARDIKLSRRPTTRTPGKSSEKFPAADLKEFRRRLLDLRAQTAQGVLSMKAMGLEESEDREADGGDGTAQTLRWQTLGQMGNLNRTIQQIDEALHRIDDGTYGVCTVCGQLIRKPRLLNQPFVLTCMECQSDMERTSR